MLLSQVKRQHNRWLPFWCYACKLVEKEIYSPNFDWIFKGTGYTKDGHYYIRDTRLEKIFDTVQQLNKEIQMATYKSAVPNSPKVGDWVWHVHHQTLVEPLTEPFINRLNYIRETKGQEVDTRLHFMRPVQNPPTAKTVIFSGDKAAVENAQRIFNSVKRAYDLGDVGSGTYNRAIAALDAARAKVKTTVQQPTQSDWEALHKKECFSYCPWNGKTLFPPRQYGRV